MSSIPEKGGIETVKEKIEDYTSTIHAIFSFIILTTRDNEGKTLSNAKFTLGRKMDTSSKNKISPENKITPDAVIQTFPALGYVVEAKKSLPNNTMDWDKYIQQLQKYDDDLVGWWTQNEKLSNHSIVLLIEIARGVEFSDYLNQYLLRNNKTFKKMFSIVEFNRADENKHYYFLRTQKGNINGDDLRETLRIGKKINRENILASYGYRKFYDTEPEPEFTMQVIWMDIFNGMKNDYIYDETMKAYVFEIDLMNITEELQKLYGSTGMNHREPQFPKKAWVKRAIEGFVCLGLAEYKANDTYRIFYKDFKSDILEKFYKHRLQDSKLARTKTKQLSFLEINQEE